MCGLLTLAGLLGSSCAGETHQNVKSPAGESAETWEKTVTETTRVLDNEMREMQLAETRRVLKTAVGLVTRGLKEGENEEVALERTGELIDGWRNRIRVSVELGRRLVTACSNGEDGKPNTSDDTVMDGGF